MQKPGGYEAGFPCVRFWMTCTPVIDVSGIVPGSLQLIGALIVLEVEGVLINHRSGSMSDNDLQPLPNTPVTPTIRQYNDNRLGAVYSSLYGFWASRHSALNAVGQNAAIARRDAYSVILFDHGQATCISNDFARSPDELLDAVVSWQTGGGTDYTGALTEAQSIMVQHWSNERYAIQPVSRRHQP